MALSYATGGTVIPYGGIGWVNYGSLTLTPGSSQNGITGVLKDGSSITFNLSNSTGGQTVDSTAAAFNFATGYTGVSGLVTLYTRGNTTTTTLTFSQIVVKDPLGVTIPNYTIYVADGEVTGTSEKIVSITNGGPWSLFTTIGSGSSPTINGLATLTLTYQGSGGTYNSPVCGTLNPTNISVAMTETGVTGRSGVVIGISMLKIKLGKSITNRLDSSDQFTLNISGAYSGTTTTFGSTYGAQPVFTYVYPSIPGNYIISESIASGSISTLSNYNQTIAYTNLTAGGTTVPTSNTIPNAITINNQDVIVATITNSLIAPTISTVKYVDKIYETINGILTYTIPIKNNGSVTITNVVFIDTIPTGSTFVPNSLFIDGSLVAGSPSSPGVTLPNINAGVTSTVTFKVQVTSTIPSPNVIYNNSTTKFSFYALPNTLTGGNTSNQVSTTINYVTISSSKTSTPIYVDCGTTITYTVLLKNLGSTTANNVIFQDTIPIQSQFVANSFTVNGITLLGQNPSVGVNIGNIPAYSTTTITFQTKVVC